METKLLFLLFFSISLYSFAQKHTLTGTIYDEDKNVLAFADVMIKNSTKGVVADEQGQFSIEIAPKDVLKISYLGFESKEIVITDQKEVSVTLQSDFEALAPSIIVADNYTRSISCGISGFTIIYTEEEAPIRSTLSPNPSSSGLFQLQLNTNYTKLTLKVFTMNGQLIQSQTHNKLSKIPQIDLSKQPKGIYLIRIVADGKLLKTKKAVRS